jgi:hypothetical protein
MKKYTQFEIADYVCGYATDGEVWFSVEDIRGMLHNALAMLEDEQDGIESTFERREYNRGY